MVAAGEGAEPNAARDKAFAELADAQRGEPEQAMVGLQFANGGGVLNFVVEHVGDLTHRMSEHFADLKGGREFVSDKVRKSLRVLRQEFGFEREHQQNTRNNAKGRGTSVEDQEKRVDKALARYTAAHRNLKVFNEPQQHARDAAIALGEKRFDDAVTELEFLETLLKDGDAYEVAVAEFNPDFETPLRPPARPSQEREAPAAPPDLADLEITSDVTVEDTGETVQLTENAAQALRAAETRVALLSELADCLA